LRVSNRSRRCRVPIAIGIARKYESAQIDVGDGSNSDVKDET